MTFCVCRWEIKIWEKSKTQVKATEGYFHHYNVYFGVQLTQYLNIIEKYFDWEYGWNFEHRNM